MEYLTAAEVRERLRISNPTLWRWERSPSMGFPTPKFFGRKKYYRLAELEAWEASQPSPESIGAGPSGAAA